MNLFATLQNQLKLEYVINYYRDLFTVLKDENFEKISLKNENLIKLLNGNSSLKKNIYHLIR